MKSITCALGLALALALSGCGDPSGNGGAAASGLKAAEDVIALSKNSKDEQELINLVEKHPEQYALSADDIIALKKEGVPDKVVQAMLYHKH